VRLSFYALVSLVALAVGVWRGAGYDAANRCGAAPEILAGVAVEVGTASYGDRVLVRGEAGAWGFVLSAPNAAVKIGERIRVEGARVELIEDFAGESGKIFPYANLMRSRGYCFEARGGEIVSVGESSAPLDRLRVYGAAARELIARTMPPVPAALSAGALLGGDDGVGGNLEEAARRAGLSHALALSGFNVAIFAGAVDLSLRRFAPRWLRIAGGALAGWLLVALAGLPASGVRAALAWSVGSAARLSYRHAEAPRALLYATLAFAWWNPLALAFDLSLQLSVLACLGIAAWATPVADKLVGVPGIPTIREAVAATLAATATTLPLTLWTFGQISLVAPLANALVAYAIPAMMWAGLVGVLVGTFPAKAGGLFGPALALPAQTFAWVAAWTGGLAWAAYPISLSAHAALWGSLAVSLLALISIIRARRLETARWAPETARLERAVQECGLA
jgi:ComEC/Rec2-related protein